jgi:hypothetical protein
MVKNEDEGGEKIKNLPAFGNESCRMEFRVNIST